MTGVSVFVEQPPIAIGGLPDGRLSGVDFGPEYRVFASYSFENLRIMLAGWWSRGGSNP